jgi:hypothetical protein
MQAKGIAHFGLLCSLSLFTNPGHAVTVSDLLISEVMANPTALSDARGEWFELYNPTTEAINLREITIGDDANDRHRIESDLLILPGEYLTLARYLDPGFIPDYVYDDFTLGNSDDEIVFSDGVSELLRLEYGNDFAVAGHSRELAGLPMIASNYDLTLASLSYGPGDIGTPGAAGSANLDLSTVPLPGAAWLFVSGLLTLFSLSSARSSPSSLRSSPNPLSSSPRSFPSSLRFLWSSRYVNPACAGGPRKRRSDVSGSHNPLSQPATMLSTRAS